MLCLVPAAQRLDGYSRVGAEALMSGELAECLRTQDCLAIPAHQRDYQSLMQLPYLPPTQSVRPADLNIPAAPPPVDEGCVNRKA